MRLWKAAVTKIVIISKKTFRMTLRMTLKMTWRIVMDCKASTQIDEATQMIMWVLAMLGL